MKHIKNPDIFLLEDGKKVCKLNEFTGADPEDYELIIPQNKKSEILELRWKDGVRVSAIEVSFVNFKGRIYGPAEDGCEIKYYKNCKWLNIKSCPAIDISGQTVYARYRQLGYARYIYNFQPIVTNRIRCIFKKTLQTNRLHKVYAISGIKCLQEPVKINNGNVCGEKQFLNRKCKSKIPSAEFTGIDRSKIDILGKEILKKGEPDFTSVAGKFLPLNYTKTSLGRENNGIETIITWNGTLIMVENGNDADWNHGSEKSRKLARGSRHETIVMQGIERWKDRWFAFAVGNEGELVGTDFARTERRLIERYEPGITISYRHRDCLYKLTAFVTPKDASSYVNIVEVEVKNPSRRRISTEFSVVMGRNKSEATHETIESFRREKENPWDNPLAFGPLPLDYRLDKDGRTVYNREKDVILQSSLKGIFSGTDRERILKIPLKLKPAGTRKFHLIIPTVNKAIKVGIDNLPQPGRYAADFSRYWKERLEENTVILTPEEHLNSFYKNALAQILITLFNEDKLKYGAYWYEEYYGPEESVSLIALAKYGYFREAKKGVEIMLNPELLDTSNLHYPYRNGTTLRTAAEIFRFSGDRAWVKKIRGGLASGADRFINLLHADNGRFTGFLPRHIYGGDIHTPAFSIGSNIIAWRGLQDTGLILKEAGENKQADIYLQEAEKLKERLRKLIDSVIVNKDTRFPFVPKAVDIGEPGTKEYQPVERAYASLSNERMGFYWAAFACWVLHSGFFHPDSKHARWITDYLENKGGLLLGLLRIKGHHEEWTEIDPHYGYGYAENLLQRGERNKFLLSFYSLLAHGMSRDTFCCPESSTIFPNRVDVKTWNRIFQESMWGWAYRDNPCFTDPLSSGANAVALTLLRDMLVREETAGGKNCLHLLSGIPSKWLLPGKKLKIEKAPAYWGKLNLSLETGRDSCSVKIKRTTVNCPDEMKIHMPHPAGKQVAKVRINGIDWHKFSGEVIELPVDCQELNIHVSFQKS